MKEFLVSKIEELAFVAPEETTALFEEGILDSITVVELVVEIEKKYDIKIPFNEIVPGNFDTVANMVQYIAAKKQIT